MTIRKILPIALFLLFTTATFAQDLQDWGKYEEIKKEAIERIEEYRKGDVQLKVVLPEGMQSSNIEVRAKLKRHDFKWGAVVKPSFVDSPYAEVYKETFMKYFNASGFNVALKPKFRYSNNEKIAEEQIMPWFIENDIYVRGHALTWEGESYLRPEDKEIYNDDSLSDEEKGRKLLESMAKHFFHAIPKWDVACWDVSNETLSNNAVNDLLPNMDTHAYWFKLADSIRLAEGRDDLVLYENDYQVISAISNWAVSSFNKPGFTSKGRPAVYKEAIQKHIANGAPVGGIGFQSRIKSGMITPDKIYERLQMFEEFNLPMQGTEFEIRDDKAKYVYTDEERRIITEYMMVMYFSHPMINGFWHWTFADSKSSENLDYTLFNYDGTPKVNGEKWMELMDGFFNTQEEAITNTKGEINLRGFYGDYVLETFLDGKMYEGNFSIDSSMADPIITINLEAAREVPSSTDHGHLYNIQIKQNLKDAYIDIQTDEYPDRSSLKLEVFSLQGKRLFQKDLSSSRTIIPMSEIDSTGMAIAVVKNVSNGENLVREKILLR